MPHTQLTLPQQYGRFLMTGSFAFTLVFWGLSQILISTPDARLDLLAVRFILKALFHQPLSLWLEKVEVDYLSFFLRQRPLLSCYMEEINFVELMD